MNMGQEITNWANDMHLTSVMQTILLGLIVLILIFRDFGGKK